MDRFREHHFGFRIPMITLPIACVFQLISLVSPYWINVDFINADLINVDVHIGLWKVCADTSEASQCFSITNFPGWFNASQAFATLGLLFAAAAIATVYVRNCSQIKNRLLGFGAVLLASAAGFFIIIGISIFGAKTAELTFPEARDAAWDFGANHLSWAWYIGIAAGILFFKAAIFLVVGIKSTANQ